MRKSQFDFLSYYVSKKGNFLYDNFPFYKVSIYDSISTVLSIFAFRENQANDRSNLSLFFKLFFKTFLDCFYQPKVSIFVDNSNNFEILFWPIEQNHFDQQIPVAKQLQSLGKKVSFVISNDKFIEVLILNKIPYIQFTNSFSFVSGIKNFVKLIFCLFKLGYCQIKSRSKARFVEVGFLQFFPFIYQTLEVSKKVISLFQVKAVFVGYDISIQGRVAALFFKSNNIKTYSIMHGTLGPEYLLKCMVVDKFFLFGSLDYKKLLLVGVDEKSISLSGAPYLDKLFFNIDKYKVEDLKYNFKRRVLIALSGSGTSVSLENHLQMINWLEQLVKLYSNCLFIIKLHRKDKEEYFESLLKFSNVELVSKNHEKANDVFYWISTSELIITGASTVGLECHLLGKPSICIDPLGELKSTYYIPDGRIEYFSSYSKLSLTFDSFIRNGVNFKEEKYYSELVSDYFFKFDGKSSERVVNTLIEDLC
jgi:hypothetical protein